MRRIATVVVVTATVLSGCAWGQRLADGSHTSYNPTGGVDSTNVGSLHEIWRIDDAQAAVSAFDDTVAIGGRDQIGATTPGQLRGYSAPGTVGCAGTPRVCTPVWTADLPLLADHLTTGGSLGGTALSGTDLLAAVRTADAWQLRIYDSRGVQGCTATTPRQCLPLGTATIAAPAPRGAFPLITVANGNAYVTWSDSGPATHLAAFHVPAVRGCAGGVACAPFMRIEADAGTFGPAVEDGLLVLRTATGAAAYSSDGTTGCAATICTPLRWFDFVGFGESANLTLTGGRLVQYSNTTVRVFAADGSGGCSGVPEHCAPLWVSSAPSTGFVAPMNVVVAKGRVYAVVFESFEARVAAYDLAGVDRCGGTPRVCTPLWSLPVGGNPIALVASGDIGLVGGAPGGMATPTLAFRLDGSGCEASTHVCQPIATIPLATAGVPDGVASGRVVFASIGTPTRMYAVGN